MEDKAIKNMVATELVYNYVGDKRTVGARITGCGTAPVKAETKAEAMQEMVAI